MKTISEAAAERGIKRVLHFTTSNGLVGILDSQQLLSHAQLPKEKRLEHIIQINCPDRSRDIGWHNFVNLSISRVNGSFFSIARNRWHASKDIYWCVLGFDSDIVTHPGVYFTTTNNAYTNTVIRGYGVDGLEALFAPKVRVYTDKWAIRTTQTPPHFTTCPQAEVLYPESVDLKYLRDIYVPSNEILDEVTAQIFVVAPDLRDKVNLIVAPEHFR